MTRTIVPWVFCVVVMMVNGLVVAQDPPAQDMLLWLKADAGVVSDSQGIATWEDQSGNEHHATRALGTMQHTTSNFGNGTHDVIRFNKDGFFALDTQPFQLQDVTIYAVAEQTGQERRSIFSTYSNAINFGYGYHLDMEGPNVRAFTSNGTGATLSDWLVPDSTVGMESITAQIGATVGSKSVYSNGNLLGNTSVPGMSFFDAPTASIGALGQLQIDHFYFRGDIAEILVYSSVDDSQRADVERYLQEKYFIPEPSTLLLCVGLILLHAKRIR